MNPTVRVVTLNLLGGSTRWAERFPLLVAGLNQWRPDLIAVQEVARPWGHSSARELAVALGDFQVALAVKGWTPVRAEGIAILSRWPIITHKIVGLGGEGRVAQYVTVEVGRHRLTLGNCHCLWMPLADRWRARQVQRFVAHLQSRPDNLVIGCGDFNAPPESRTIAVARQTLTSAYAACHGREPEYTCPTPLRSGSRLRDALSDTLYRLAGTRATGPWRATLDYIFVGPGVRVVACEVCFNQPSATDPTLYPSDHFGLMATVELTANDKEGTGR